MRRHTHFLDGLVTVLSLTMLLASVANAQVVVNEFAYDDSGGDNEEFIELYNAGASAQDLTSWTIDLLSGNGGAVYDTINLPSVSLAAGDYFVIAFAATTPDDPSIVDYTTTVSSIQNGSPDSLILRNESGAAVDAVAYETGSPLGLQDLPPEATEGSGIFGALSGITGINRRSTRFAASVSRLADGADTDDNDQDFALMPATPGRSNSDPLYTQLLPYYNSFDDAAGTGYGELWGRWVDGYAEDPVTNGLLQQPGASPQGGNAGMLSDTSGGGNSFLFNFDAAVNQELECYVYVDSTVRGAGGYNGWSIALGSVGESYYPTVTDSSKGLSSGFGVVYGNNVGTSVGAVIDTGVVEIAFIERYNGVDNLIGTVPVSAGVNDGWQRLLLRRVGTSITGVLGGTYGDGGATGVIATGTGLGLPSGVSAGFRESGSPNDSWLWIDDLRIGLLQEVEVDATNGAPDGVTTFNTIWDAIESFCVSTDGLTTGPNYGVPGINTINVVSFGPYDEQWDNIGTAIWGGVDPGPGEGRFIINGDPANRPLLLLNECVQGSSGSGVNLPGTQLDFNDMIIAWSDSIKVPADDGFLVLYSDGALRMNNCVLTSLPPLGAGDYATSYTQETDIPADLLDGSRPYDSSLLPTLDNGIWTGTSGGSDLTELTLIDTVVTQQGPDQLVCYGGSIVTILGDSVLSSGARYGLQSGNVAQITIDGLDCHSNASYGLVQFSGGGTLDLNNVSSHDNVGLGLYTRAQAGTPTITNSSFSDNGTVGVFIWGGVAVDWVLDNLTIMNNGTWGLEIYSDADTVNGISNSVVFNNGALAADDASGGNISILSDSATTFTLADSTVAIVGQTTGTCVQLGRSGDSAGQAFEIIDSIVMSADGVVVDSSNKGSNDPSATFSAVYGTVNGNLVTDATVITDERPVFVTVDPTHPEFLDPTNANFAGAGSGRAVDIDGVGTLNDTGVADTNWEVAPGSYAQGDGALQVGIAVGDLANTNATASLSAGALYAIAGNGTVDVDLTDDVFATAGVNLLGQDNVSPALSFQVELDFTAGLNTVEIDEINVINAHDGDGSRAFVNADVEVDTGSGYAALTNLLTGPYGRAAEAASVMRAGWTGSASAVQKVRLTFYDVSHNTTGFFQDPNDNTTTPPTNYPNQGPIVKEVDVIGVVTPTSVDNWSMY